MHTFKFAAKVHRLLHIITIVVLYSHNQLKLKMKNEKMKELNNVILFILSSLHLFIP
jgi:hypothetical protein